MRNTDHRWRRLTALAAACLMAVLLLVPAASAAESAAETAEKQSLDATATEETGGFIGWISRFFRANVKAASSELPYGLFENEANESPDLYVHKTVASAVQDPDLEPPADAEFRFVLKVNGEYWAEKEYEVYDADSEQVKNFADSGGTQVEVPFMTDSNGGFTLKAGQTARFPFIGAGARYEVFEETGPDGNRQFVQTRPPAGGSRTGTVDADGSVAEFENTWQPEKNGTKTELHVAKTVVLPDGFELPETPEFTFRISISSQPYANQPYTVRNADGTESSGVTDENGQFALKGGQTGVFKDIPTNHDYEIRELPSDTSDGWRQAGSTGEEGSTKAPLTYAEFVNTESAFAVTKRMEGYSTPDIDFTFVLTDSAGSPMASAPYWLYDADRRLVRPEQLMTDSKGQFTLKPGQTALFTGIAPGTQYAVKEVPLKGYRQTMPDDPDGYVRTVDDRSLEVLEFVNAAEGTARLTVVKQDEEGTPLSGVKFKLRRGQGNSLFASYAVMEQEGDAWRITGWGRKGTELTTDAGGQFVITGFDEGTYSLVETQPLEGYEPIKDVVFDIKLYENSGADGGLADVTLRRSSSNERRTDVTLSGSMKDGTGTLTLTNYEGTELPRTGGVGIYAVFAAGLAVLAAGAAVMEIRRRRLR